MSEPSIEHIPLLAIETSTDRTVLALLRPDGTTAGFADLLDGRHGRGLMPAVRAILKEAGLTPKSLRALAVGLGPGSYTGTRIAVTAAKTLAYAAGAAVWGFESLDVFAHSAPGEGPLAVVVDAQRGSAHLATYERRGGQLVRRAATRLLPLEEIAEAIGSDARLIGPAFGRFQVPGRPDALTVKPTPEGLMIAALAAIHAGPAGSPWFLEPLYLRPSSAEEKRARVGRP